MLNKVIKQQLELLLQSGIKEVYPPVCQKGQHLDELAARYRNCQKCELAKGRTKLVYGEGNPDAFIMIIGEGPGASEDLSGRPFVGKAGELLTKMLAAIHLSREEVYIGNIVKCRPPSNRNPLPEERLACLPYLLEQISIIQPKLLLFMGLVAAQTLLQTSESMGELRKREHLFQNIPAFVTYHPAALLRNPNWKHGAWADLQKFEQRYYQLRDGS
ncbi:MAG: uracil-DNA glycosylase [Candidatus Cloacimonadaceae bacterium]|jgi:uracil-DNA glycosylase family 4